MNKLISLELKRNSLRSYHTAALISALCLLALLYLFAAMPKLDGTETGLDMFMTYRSLIGITNIIGMVIFAVLSAVMSARNMQEKGQFCCFPIPSPTAVLFLRKSEWYFSIRQPPCFYAG